jgi:hypothetical protein
LGTGRRFIVTPAATGTAAGQGSQEEQTQDPTGNA